MWVILRLSFKYGIPANSVLHFKKVKGLTRDIFKKAQKNPKTWAEPESQANYLIQRLNSGPGLGHSVWKIINAHQVWIGFPPPLWSLIKTWTCVHPSCYRLCLFPKESCSLSHVSTWAVLQAIQVSCTTGQELQTYWKDFFQLVQLL